MKAAKIAQWRMHNLALWGPPLKHPKDVVARLGALQAQEFSYAKWSLAQRVKDATDATVSRVFDDGKIIRTHVLRPTWHFVLPRDLRWMLALTAPRVRASLASSHRRQELDDRFIARTNRLIEKALSGGEHLMRKELVDFLKRNKITGDGQRFGHILLRAELDALICSGATQGKQQTYALLDERVPKGRNLEGDEALAELARRYFTARGPSTLKDFSWWSSLKMAECKRSVEILGKELESREADGRTYWFARGSAPPKLTKGHIDLIQVYDECVVGYTVSRDALLAKVEGDIPQSVMFFWHPILLDGQVIGHWRRRSQGRSQFVEMFMYRSLNRSENRSLDTAIRRYEGFLGEEIEVRMT